MIYSGGHLHIHFALFCLCTLSVTRGARIFNNLTGTAAVRAGARNGEKPLLHAQGACAAAGLTTDGLGPGGGAGAVAAFARDVRRDVDIYGIAADSLLQGQLELVAEIGAAKHLVAAATPSGPENIPEDVPEKIDERVGTAEPTLCALADARMAELIVGGARLRILEDLVGFLGFLEFALHLRIAGVAIGMELHCEAPVRLLDVGVGRVAADAEHLVKVTLRHCARF